MSIPPTAVKMQTWVAVNWGQGFRAGSFVRVAAAGDIQRFNWSNSPAHCRPCPADAHSTPVPDFRRILLLLAQHITSTRIYVAVAKLRRSPVESAVAARSLKTKTAFTLAPPRGGVVAAGGAAPATYWNESELERDSHTFHYFIRKAKMSDSFPIDDDNDDRRSIVQYASLQLAV